MVVVREGRPVVEKERPVMCYECGTLLGLVKTEWTQEGMARFREKAAELKRDHSCRPQETRKPTASVGN